MEKKVYVAVIVLLGLICIIFLAIILMLFSGYSKTSITNTKGLSSNPSRTNLNYYLPADFAAIKLTKGVEDANVSGALISFEDDSGNSYDYHTNDSIEEASATFVILKDQLSPDVPADWNFSKVRFISLRYIMGSGRMSAVTSRIAIDPSQISPDFGESCSVDSQEGGKILCQ